MLLESMKTQDLYEKNWKRILEQFNLEEEENDGID